jgi:hypothetical protein
VLAQRGSARNTDASDDSALGSEARVRRAAGTLRDVTLMFEALIVLALTALAARDGIAAWRYFARSGVPDTSAALAAEFVLLVVIARVWRHFLDHARGA